MSAAHCSGVADSAARAVPRQQQQRRLARRTWHPTAAAVDGDDRARRQPHRRRRHCRLRRPCPLEAAAGGGPARRAHMRRRRRMQAAAPATMTAAGDAHARARRRSLLAGRAPRCVALVFTAAARQTWRGGAARRAFSRRTAPSARWRAWPRQPPRAIRPRRTALGVCYQSTGSAVEPSRQVTRRSSVTVGRGCRRASLGSGNVRLARDLKKRLADAIKEPRDEEQGDGHGERAYDRTDRADDAARHHTDLLARPVKGAARSARAVPRSGWGCTKRVSRAAPRG